MPQFKKKTKKNFNIKNIFHIKENFSNYTTIIFPSSNFKTSINFRDMKFLFEMIKIKISEKTFNRDIHFKNGISETCFAPLLKYKIFFLYITEKDSVKSRGGENCFASSTKQVSWLAEVSAASFEFGL